MRPTLRAGDTRLSKDIAASLSSPGFTLVNRQGVTCGVTQIRGAPVLWKVKVFIVVRSGYG